jgi:hypothetical protein
MISEMAVVQIVHPLTITWSFSRIITDRNAWRPFWLDIFSTGIALFSWMIMVAASVTNSPLEAVSSDPLIALVLFILVGVIYVLLILVFVQVRERLGSSE